MKRYTALALIAIVASASSEAAFDEAGTSGDREAIQAVTARWIVGHYDPSDFLGSSPQAICLVVGQRVGNRPLAATAQSARRENLDPDPGVLSRLRDVEPKVLPVSKCVYGDDLAETLSDTGEREIVLGVGHPEWVTPNLARITATLRENDRTWYTYSCSVARVDDAWELQRCL